MPLSRAAPLVILAASVGALAAAFAFQHIGGLRPCVLCIYQRYAYGAAIALALMALALARRGPGLTAALVALCGIAFMVGGGVAADHVGVQQGWWLGSSSCVGESGIAGTVEALRAQIMAAPLVRCDEVAWSLLGLSMPAWNFLMSLGLAAGSGWAAWALWRGRRAHGEG